MFQLTPQAVESRLNQLSESEQANVDKGSTYVEGVVSNAVTENFSAGTELKNIKVTVKSSEISKALGGGKGAKGVNPRELAAIFAQVSNAGWKVSEDKGTYTLSAGGKKRQGRTADKDLSPEDLAAAKARRAAKKAAKNAATTTPVAPAPETTVATPTTETATA